MKKKKNVNTISPIRRHLTMTLVCLGFLLAIAAGVMFGFERLRAIYEQQFTLTDRREQVVIHTGVLVKPDVLAEMFALSNGANLAQIDFAAKREEILSRIPTLKNVSITREMPNRVILSAEERTPIARLGLCRSNTTSGRVVDEEGVVFVCRRGTQMLPTIREPMPPGTGEGARLKERARAALELISQCRDTAFSDLSILEVDTSKPDFLIATLGDYSRVKITWQDFDREQTLEGIADLRRRLTNLVKAIRSQVVANVKIWNATMPDAIYADTQEKL